MTKLPEAPLGVEMGMTPDQMKALDLHLRETPKQYRGLLLTPVTQRDDPHYENGEVTFYGWTVTDSKKKNRSPEHTWSKTLEGAIDIVDAIHEAGGYDYETGEELPPDTWSDKFWGILRDKKSQLSLSSAEDVSKFVRQLAPTTPFEVEPLFSVEGYDDNEYRGSLVTHVNDERFCFLRKGMSKLDASTALGTTWPEKFRKPA